MQMTKTQKTMPHDDEGRALPLRVVDESWRHRPGGTPPPEWADALWSLDGAVRNAIAGGWTSDEIAREVQDLTGVTT